MYGSRYVVLYKKKYHGNWSPTRRHNIKDSDVRFYRITHLRIGVCICICGVSGYAELQIRYLKTTASKPGHLLPMRT